MRTSGDVAASEAAYAQDRGEDGDGPEPITLSTAPGESAGMSESRADDHLRAGLHETPRHDIRATA